MPQIWPMNWVLLFVFFVAVLYVFLNMLYFVVSPSLESGSQETISSKNFNSLIWKW